jgi:hypothetical protein
MIKKVVFYWDDSKGDCYDCGNPAAYKLVNYTDNNLMCSRCAAQHASMGESIEYLFSQD